MTELSDSDSIIRHNAVVEFADDIYKLSEV